MSAPLRQSAKWLRWTAAATLALARRSIAQGEDSLTTTDPAPDPGSLIDEAFFLRLGFSFIVGLAAGFALKIAFKVALVVIGATLIGIFALQYAGLAEVDWSSVELQYDSGTDWVGTQGGALLDFMGRNLPSAASFIAGLALGLKL